MRPGWLAVLGLTLVLARPEPVLSVSCPAGSLQEAAGPTPSASQASGTSQGPSSPSTYAFVTPEERVAALVREALRAPDRDETWACLDLALSEMNAPAADGQDSESQVRRVADSLLCPSGSAGIDASSSPLSTTPPGGLQRVSGLDGLLNGAWQRVNRTLDAWTHEARAMAAGTSWPQAALLLFVLASLFWLGRKWIRSGLMRLRRRKGPRGSSAKRGASDSRGASHALALALWEGGLPYPEIARRTGLAQDALSVLLALEGRERSRPESEAESPTSTPPSPYALGVEGR